MLEAACEKVKGALRIMGQLKTAYSANEHLLLQTNAKTVVLVARSTIDCGASFAELQASRIIVQASSI